MNTTTSSFAVRAKNAFQTIGSLPVFLVITLIPWLLAAHAFTLSQQSYAAGSRVPGAAFQICGIAIAALTALSTLWFFVVWLVVLVRGIRDRK